MVMALGVGAWTAALFHLFTHAMFKAGLFLGSGSVAHSVHSFDMKKDMGGMKRFMPKTYWTFLICTARPHRPLPAGRLLVEGRDPRRGPAARRRRRRTPPSSSWALIGALMTAAYMTRCVYLTFFGEPRGHAADPHHPPHESGPRIVVPLYILSGMAIIAGFANLPNTGFLVLRARRHRAALRALLRAEGRLLPRPCSAPSSHPEFNIGIALVSDA